jgi:hypothetical protein
MSKDASLQEADRKVKAEPVFRLIYRSHSLLPHASTDRDDAGLAEILRVARRNNADLGVTGALMLYDDWFAQVLEGPQAIVEALFERIRADPRHEDAHLDHAGRASNRMFERWAMAVVAEHHQPDMPMIAVTGGLSQGAPWKVNAEQEVILRRLRDLTRGYGRGS